MNFQDALKDIQTLDIQAPGTWPGWIHIAAAVLAAVAIIGGGVYYKLMPMNEELKSVKRQELVLFDEFQTKQKKVVALDAYKVQLQEMERSFGAMLKQLPSRSEVANLLNDISQTRVASSLDEELFQPRGEVAKDFYAEIPNKIVVTGSYHEMGTFVSGVAGLPRIVTIDEVSISAVGKRSARGLATLSPDDLRMTAVAKTYRYLDDEELAAAEKIAKAKKAKKRGRRR